ncbi:MAG: MerR family transcriptional regulator [Oscillospiraceae bacterium]|nr:MerR family transcriptional regulator [Oscillospiraceae bacterium]
MKTVTQIAKQTGVSVRTLHHYDAIGLLKPTRVTEAGYRLYDDEALERLYLILLFREIGFPLKEIRGILDAPDYDRNRVLEKQIELLEQKKTRLQALIYLTKGIKLIGVKYLEMDGFNINKLNDYSAQAKTLYGKTDAYKEYEQKARGRSKEQENALGGQVMDFFVRLGQMKDLSPDSEAVQTWVKELQEFFTEHFYTCTPQLLLGLSEMYAGGGSMNENIDAVGGKGTGEFAREAIKIYCGQ